MIVPTNYNLLFLLLLPLVIDRWSQKPLFLKRALWIIPVLLVLTFCFGYIDEMRDYYEGYPIILLLMAHTLLGKREARNDPCSP
jgi:hypothetical protein